jgi:hypothetical protein
MRKSRVVTLSLGLLAAVLFAGAFTLTPTEATAGTVCSCPSSYIWRTAHGSATSSTPCPTAACRASAEAAAAATCGADGVCDFGNIIYACELVGGQYRAYCDLQFVCNICIDYPD